MLQGAVDSISPVMTTIHLKPRLHPLKWLSNPPLRILLNENKKQKIFLFLKEALRLLILLNPPGRSGEYAGIRTPKNPGNRWWMRFRKNAQTRRHSLEGWTYGNVVRFLPPLVITEELANKAMDVFADVVRKVERELT